MGLKQEILNLLVENSRLSPQQMAAMLGVEDAEILSTMAQLEKERVILKYTAVVDWEKAGEEKVIALIDVKVTPQRDVGFDDVARRIYRFPEVRTVYLMSGAYDLSVLVEARSLKEVAFFVSNKLATIPHVSSTTTHFLLKRYKQDGVIFADSEEDRRLVVSP